MSKYCDNINIKILLATLSFLSISLSITSTELNQKTEETATIVFRTGNDALLENYSHNKSELDKLKKIVTQYEDAILTGNGHIRIVANIPLSKSENPSAINFAAVRASVVGSYLKSRFRFMTKWNFTFYIDPSNEDTNALKVCYIPSSIAIDAPKGIYYTQHRDDPAMLRAVINHYNGIPYLSRAKEQKDIPALGLATDRKATSPISVEPLEAELNPKEVLIAIYYRWDKSNLDSLYLSNPQHLVTLDSVLTLKSAKYIDTLSIVAFASPEGHPDYNKRLSERRAATIREYLVNKYPYLSPNRIVTEARGENWEGVLKFAEADKNLPSKNEVLDILKSKMTSIAKQKALTALDGGSTYYRYILPNYYRYLRNGASVLITYDPNMPKLPDAIRPPEHEITINMPKLVADVPSLKYIRPFAWKTNLLFDAATLFNVELEVPTGKNFSLLAEWTFPFWGGLGNAGGVAPVPAYSEKFTFQMLSGGLEARYWFRRSQKLNESAERWGDYNPLCGWFVGLYGGAGLYDFQFGESGMQGEFYIASGISAGYAHPIGKYFHLEYSLGVGYIATRYYNYTMMDAHKVVDIRSDGKYDRRQQSLFGPTKLKVSLVWIPRFKVKVK